MVAAGRPIYAMDFAPCEWDEDTTLVSNISSSTPTGSETGERFTAPLSGKVLVAVRAAWRSNGTSSGDRIAIAPTIYEGDDATGDVVQSGDAFSHGVVSIPEAISTGVYYTTVHSGWSLVQGLKPTFPYFAACQYYSIQGAVQDIEDQAIFIWPLR